ncbi:23S rRNA (guanine(745)-N(1))-methyltransferase [Pullulanibacillus pueri]|uniref:23S rRNA (Guanine(745)-N(1))-methyltransferase n=2 Tax=Pullulanibacillus pueri TaxID=1437324 RepID=A0A8J2ZTW8_9BACL|nr:23S rRNA (guanine(745)-N(1))-methyltransferase [Pullulanibacillus pueri]
MSLFKCPTCGEQLLKQKRSYRCGNNHNFDMAKSGYVNLLMSQQKKDKSHGDNKFMVRARKAFLDKGYYKVLLQKLSEVVHRNVKNESVILDMGCGECWYSANIYDYLQDHEIQPVMMGIDISIPAVDSGAKRNKALQLAVASAFNMPIGDNACDLALSLFAPFSPEEARRILKEQGVLVRAIPLERHLWALKKVLYDQPYLNEIDSNEIDGFELLERFDIRDKIYLPTHEDILNLFSMTPYYYKSGQKNQRKLENVSQLETEIEFGILVYRKKE